MSKNSSIQRLPVEVDPFRLVEQGRFYEGRIPVNDYPRLRELLFDGGSDPKTDQTLVDVALTFTKTKTKLPIIEGKISSTLRMPCQRCLKTKEVSFKTTLAVVLVSNDAQAERLQEGYDTWLVEDQRLFLQDFIEDEILLALPNIVMHEACDLAVKMDKPLTHDDHDQQNEETQKKANPFAVLKNLKLD